MLFKPAPNAATNTITVDTLDDPGTSSECSLHGAIENANGASTNPDNNCVAGTGTDTIVFSVSGTITLGSGLPAIANSSGGSLTIDGSGQTITIDGANSYQVLRVNSGATLNLSNVTVARGVVNYPNSGAAVFNAGTLNVVDSIFSNNRMYGSSCCALGGGALSTTGAMTVTGSTFSGNATVSGAASGGAIEIHFSGSATVTNSTFSNNSSSWQGGAIQVQDTGSAMLTNDTFSGNSAAVDGDSIHLSAGASATVEGSLFVHGDPRGNCGGSTITDGGYNISDDATCSFGSSSGSNGDTIGDNVAESNITLDPNGLQNNGGRTETIARSCQEFRV
jgi:predicted outer membrane repeat protein